jgi:hypothetical protein
MTVKQLIRKLKNPPCERIAAIRIEFADGGIYEVAPDTRYATSSAEKRGIPARRKPLTTGAPAGRTRTHFTSPQ